jgi:hypothetical protein
MIFFAPLDVQFPCSLTNFVEELYILCVLQHLVVRHSQSIALEGRGGCATNDLLETEDLHLSPVIAGIRIQIERKLVLHFDIHLWAFAPIGMRVGSPRNREHVPNRTVSIQSRSDRANDAWVRLSQNG